MAYRKKTLRIMSPTARKVARLVGEQQSIAKRFKNLVPEIQQLEADSRALQTAKSPEPIQFIRGWLSTKPEEDKVLAIQKLIVNYRMNLEF